MKLADSTDASVWALDRVVPPSPGEITLLHRLGAPDRAHSRITDYVVEYSRAMELDHGEMRRQSDPDSAPREECLADLAKRVPGLRQRMDEYREQAVARHGRAAEKAWAEHARQLERASASALAEAARAHNRAPTWMGLWALQRAAEVVKALPRPPRVVRPRGTRTRPRIRRAAARRAAGVRAGTDPGDDAEPHRPPRRGELRHISFALGPRLEQVRPEAVAR